MFKDRLVCEEDADKLETILRHSLRRIAGKDVSLIQMPIYEDSHVGPLDSKGFFFTNFKADIKLF